MRIVALAVVLASICFAYDQTAHAQMGGYSINTPGQLPTQVVPNGMGGYSINRPGQLPTQVVPNGMGGYSVNTPGQLPTQINPTFPTFPTYGR
jgi:hypothetical protein